MKKVAVIVGHSITDKGAFNKDSGMSEFDYNIMIAEFVKDLAVGFEFEIVYRTKSYSALPSQVNKTDADLFISLHCNAFNKIASGTETLISGSEKSTVFANILHPKMVSLFELPNRGIKLKSLKDRGGLIMHQTKMPGALLEPGFIDNNNDFEVLQKNSRKYAVVICDAIDEYFKS